MKTLACRPKAYKSICPAKWFFISVDFTSYMYIYDYVGQRHIMIVIWLCVGLLYIGKQSSMCKLLPFLQMHSKFLCTLKSQIMNDVSVWRKQTHARA